MNFDKLCINLLNEKLNQKDYKFYVIAKNKIESGWEYKEDAKDQLGELPKNLAKGAKVYAKSHLKKLNLNPDDDKDWGQGKEYYEAVENDDVVDTDDKVESKAELKKYTTMMAKKAFGDEVDMSKVDSMVDNAIKKATKDGKVDWETAAGIITGSFNESLEEAIKKGKYHSLRVPKKYFDKTQRILEDNGIEFTSVSSPNGYYIEFANDTEYDKAFQIILKKYKI
jgi:hypothetical protein